MHSRVRCVSRTRPVENDLDVTSDLDVARVWTAAGPVYALLAAGDASLPRRHTKGRAHFNRVSGWHVGLGCSVQLKRVGPVGMSENR